jgi:hypothetical protein
MVARYGNWRRLSSKPHRDFGSVVLEPDVKRRLLEDTNEFLGNERWYADRGIPYRRGYLLYGTSRMIISSLPNRGSNDVLQELPALASLARYML